MLNEKGKPMTANEKSKLAYKILQDLTGEEHPPGNDDFNDWVLRCMEVISKKLNEKPVVTAPRTTVGAKK